jgi:hypothetical protein
MRGSERSARGSFRQAPRRLQWVLQSGSDDVVLHYSSVMPRDKCRSIQNIYSLPTHHANEQTLEIRIRLKL